MTKPYRFGTTLTALAVISLATGCANPMSRGTRSASNLGGTVDSKNIGLATRAQMALLRGDVTAATDLAERAVAASPRDAGFRALLGNIYLAGGRFASAESAYRDSLSLSPDQAPIALKLVLAQIAQGKREAAVGLLNEARNALDPADVGLALALAGQPTDAIVILETASRQVGADARARQNLALAYALSGDWTAARTIAGQDLPADQLEARIEQWMKFASPTSPSDQVAALIGVTPTADLGQPVRLALTAAADAPVRAAAVEPVATVAAAEPVAVAAYEPAPMPVAEIAEAAPPVVVVAEVAPIVTAPVAPPRAARPRAAAPVRAASYIPQRPPVRKAALRLNGSSRAVVQLGAYGSRDRVSAAWSEVSRRFASLRAYSPMSARFDSARGTVYRLSVKGFGSDREARLLCESLHKAGKTCFVRSVAGDSPVRLASR